MGAVGNRSARRTKLITPGNNWSLIEKAARSEADIVHLELEDGVPHDQKADARVLVARALRELNWSGKEVWVRINPFNSGFTEADVEGVVHAGPTAISLAKANHADDIAQLSELIAKAERAGGMDEGGVAITCVIETIRGLDNIDEIASSHRMSAMAYGIDDLANEFGYRVDRRGDGLETLFVRSRIIFAAHLAGIDAIAPPCPFYRDVVATRVEAQRSARYGFDGMSAVSPGQIATIKECFDPSPTEVDWARAVIEGLEVARGRGQGVWVTDGMMTDAPHVKQARRILDRTPYGDGS